MKRLLALLFVAALAAPLVSAGADPLELWVIPTNKAPDQALGNWPNSGPNAYFTFGIPSNYHGFVEAKLSAIGKSTGTGTFTINTSQAADGDAQNICTTGPIVTSV